MASVLDCSGTLSWLLPDERGAATDAVSDLGRRLDITSYDAAYIELAARRHLPLATFDARLRKACAALKVAVLP